MYKSAFSSLLFVITRRQEDYELVQLITLTKPTKVFEAVDKSDEKCVIKKLAKVSTFDIN